MIGTGLIILIVLWSIAACSVIVLCSSQGNVKYITVAPTFLAILITIVLLTLPKESTLQSSITEPAYMYSYTSLLWILMLTSIALTLVLCLLAYFVTDIMEPLYAKVSKSYLRIK